MKRILINGTHPNETRIAYVDDNRVHDLAIETNQQQLIQSNIYIGVVRTVKRDLEAAFVDIGVGRHGLLSLSRDNDSDNEEESANVEPTPWQPDVQVDDRILVQVNREPRGDKGPGLTRALSIPGHYVVIKPNSSARAVSRVLTHDERENLRELGRKLPKVNNMGWILRTSAKSRSLAELTEDFQRSVHLWQRINEVSESHMNSAPVLLYSENEPIHRILRDRFRADGTTVHIDDPKIFRQAQDFASAFMPELKANIILYRGQQPIFRSFRVDNQIQTAFTREVTLRSGGNLVFDPTEALLSIDVNSAKNTGASSLKETAINTNLQAAREIARQLVLRNIGGLVVIDFIDMDFAEHREQVEREMRMCLSQDPAKTEMGMISTFGLLELSRQRRRPSIYDTHYEECDLCVGGRYIPSMETNVNRFLRSLAAQVLDTSTQDNQYLCRLPEDIAVYLLNKERVYLRELETKTHKQIVILPDDSVRAGDYEISSRHVSQLDYENGSNLAEEVKTQSEKSKKRQRKDFPEPVVPSTEALVKPVYDSEYQKRNGSNETHTPPQTQSSTSGGISGWLKALFGGKSRKQPDQKKKKPKQAKQGTSSKKRGVLKGKQKKTEQHRPQQSKGSDNRTRSDRQKQSKDNRNRQQKGQKEGNKPKSSASQGSRDKNQRKVEAKHDGNRRPKKQEKTGSQTGSGRADQSQQRNPQPKKASKEEIQSSKRMPPSNRRSGGQASSKQTPDELTESSQTSSDSRKEEHFKKAASANNPKDERANPSPSQDSKSNSSSDNAHKVAGSNEDMQVVANETENPVLKAAPKTTDIETQANTPTPISEESSNTGSSTQSYASTETVSTPDHSALGSESEIQQVEESSSQQPARASNDPRLRKSMPSG